MFRCWDLPGCSALASTDLSWGLPGWTLPKFFQPSFNIYDVSLRFSCFSIRLHTLIFVQDRFRSQRDAKLRLRHWPQQHEGARAPKQPTSQWQRDERGAGCARWLRTTALAPDDLPNGIGQAAEAKESSCMPLAPTYPPPCLPSDNGPAGSSFGATVTSLAQCSSQPGTGTPVFWESPEQTGESAAREPEDARRKPGIDKRRLQTDSTSSPEAQLALCRPLHIITFGKGLLLLASPPRLPSAG
ncbi:hypothetical protein MAPG_02362 [Magnaporthiopsis poae ATCC 64411]|uniref:Uncharacterized protein n=1 Tax=Magnaporthiopsis poae (strain ATCC 64411 / 73-15) TaxID=644358 RepID=A0A0C4DR59_MAGP6|nr:hypothetical protein MAPG_02362 [Magnaporthiopsis poae ATCC 64411]